jgi:hypothetical protein
MGCLGVVLGVTAVIVGIVLLSTGHRAGGGVIVIGMLLLAGGFWSGAHSVGKPKSKQGLS